MKAPPGFVWTFPAEVDRVQDGDTVVAHVLLHPNEGGEAHAVNIRVDGINAPELNTAAGTAAKAYAETLLPPGAAITLIARKREKYGRFLARVILSNGDDLSALMIAAGHAVPYLT